VIPAKSGYGVVARSVGSDGDHTDTKKAIFRTIELIINASF
jgi:hypothetical protein